MGRAVSLAFRALSRDDVNERQLGNPAQNRSLFSKAEVVQEPFDCWHKLEETYRFAKDHEPELLASPFEAANRQRETSMRAAEATTGEVLPRGGDQKSKEKKSNANCANDFQAQSNRASANGISHFTQRKLDRLARDFPEAHAKVKSGELSVNAAAISVGIAIRTIPLPLEPEAAARRILRHFQGDRLAALLDAIG